MVCKSEELTPLVGIESLAYACLFYSLIGVGHLHFNLVLSSSKKGTIVLGKKYYRFHEKVLSFLPKSTIVFAERYYRFYRKVLSPCWKGCYAFFSLACE